MLLELKLPGLYGTELIKKLRQSQGYGKLPVIILTGYYKGEKYRTAAKSLGVRHYLEKPLKASGLVSAICEELNLEISAPPVLSEEPRQSTFALNRLQYVRLAGE